MGLFKKNKKNTAPQKTEQITKEELLKNDLHETPEDNNCTNDFSPELINAIDHIIPVISNGDLNLIPSVYSGEVIAASIDEADLKDLLILADYTHKFITSDEKNKQGYAPTFLNCIATGIVNRIKAAEKLYTICNNLLRYPYPQIASGFAVMFFSEENAKSWAEDYSKNHETEVYVKELCGEEIKSYFAELTSLGIVTIGIEPTISKITLNHTPIFKTEFETVANPAVQFLSLRFIQLDKSKIYHDNAKQAHGALLSAIISSKFICPGKTVNGKFIAASLKKDDFSFLSVYTDKKELEKTKLENPSAKEFLNTAELKELSFAELEEFLKLPQISALTINISGIGFTIKREIYEGLYNAIKSNPGKNIKINVE